MTVQAKFKVVALMPSGPNDTILSMQACTDEGSRDFAKYTPWGELRMGIHNDAPALKEFELYKEYTLTFTRIG